MVNFINEDDIVKWVKDQNGILHTRKISNINVMDRTTCPDNTLVCLTGYDSIINFFFQKIIQSFKQRIILITLETDGFQMKLEYINHPAVKHWFTWNKSFAHEKVTCLPIGLNYDRQQTVLSKYLLKKSLIPTDERKLLCINCSLHTNNSRGSLLEKVTKKWQHFCDIVESIPFLQEYYQPSHIEGKIKISVTHPKCYDLLAKYKFILSPPGAGVDCHRTWEALYLNIVPIVLASSINELYADLPIVVVNSWDEINEAFLHEKYKEICLKKERDAYKMEKLNLTYWLTMIKKSQD
jgi:hypothetical protein